MRQGHKTSGRAHPNTVETLYARALTLHKRGQSDQAAPLYRKIISKNASHDGALHLLGLCALDDGDPEKAVGLIGRALAVRPDYAEALFDHGRACLALGRIEEAARDFEQAAACAPQYAEPRHALGLLHLETGNPDEALRLFYATLAVVPDDPTVWLHTAWALKSLDRAGDALKACARAVEFGPDTVPARLEMAELLIEAGRPDEAAGHLDAAPESAWQCSLRGRAALARQDVPEAEAAFRRALELDPADSFGVVAELSLLDLEPAPQRAPLAWVRRVYDGQARLWDQSAAGERGYQAPDLLAQALAAVPGQRSGLTVLDAGCGSGLCAPWLRPLAARLEGVDLSPAMLELARAKGLYERLVCGDVTDFLGGCREEYDLIVGAAVFIYTGELAPVLTAAYAALCPGGLLAFTLFPGAKDAYSLTAAAYYLHDIDAVLARAGQAGFTVAARLEGIHEYRDDAPVTGCALVLGKPA
ncbi:hypothetical protein DVDV_2288 [Desulfovibrio sp. DV]|uniref:tetratricopeptide repeat protein n=1 Tax=Desulfovibrio sp. DV TaxID=1844708 RepID=UPI00094BBB5E|nr:tetratricopeptide repeat protein [Desulfovibrio sp. DV]OLN27088.1 hypothetical protein DVDV_2288 [Desulfovibrio sp. DV]